MKILLSGLPKSGKSTLLNKIVGDVKNKTGFLTKEVLEDGQRTGFATVTNKNVTTNLASTKLETSIKVSKYYVDLESFEKIIPELMIFNASNLLYIDEIGEMELYSESFKKLVNSYLDSGNNFIGTISAVFNDSFTEEIRAREDITLFEINETNRTDIELEIRNLLGINEL